MNSRPKAARRIWVGLLCLILAVTVMTPVGGAHVYAAGETWYDGTYRGTGDGFRDKITIDLTIENGRIAAIDEVSQSETASYWEKANVLFSTIITEQSADVDSVSGATKSSEGIKAAVSDALAKASVDPEGWYSSGEGTEKKPFVIETANQLAKFATIVDEGEALAGQYVVLGANIDLSEQENWNPIGTEGATASAKKFAGTFDGNGKTISNMNIVQEGLTGETNAGLFSALDTSAVVRNLTLSNVAIDMKGSGVLRAGGIAGDTVNGSETAGTVLDNISVTGSISADSTGTALVFAGGIAGRAMTFVKASNSWTDVDTAAISRGGNNSGYAGGIFGMSGNNSLIVNVSTFGDIYGSSPKSTNFGGMAGGLGGMLASKTYNVYSTGNATVGNGGTSHKWVGVLAGEYPTGGMTKLADGSYAYPETGAFRDFGYYPKDAVLTIEKWTGGNSTSETTALRATGTSPTMSTHDKVFEDSCTAMDRANMMTQTFADTLNANLKETRKLLDAYGYTAVDINNWELAEGRVLPTGSKWVSTDPDASIFAGGTGTEDDPYQIENEEQLRNFAGSLTEGVDYDGYFVKVTADIDVSSEEWTPIGGQDFAFNGTFDGAGHNITGMRAGTESEPYKMGRENPYFGFFGVLGKDAVIKDLHLKDVSVKATSPRYIYVGGIAAVNDAPKDGKKAMLIDGCSVTGTMEITAEEGNSFLAGIIASQYKGAVINSWTDVDLSCTVKKGNAIAEVGGLVGLNNRGLAANCYTLGDVFGSASRNDGDEGMASTGNLVGVQAGDLAGCYSKGDNTTAEYSVYAGELAGWITGIGKVYSCYYNKEATMTIDGRQVNPPADFGTKVAPGVNEEGDAYVGGIVDELIPYIGNDYRDIAGKLNEKFATYPIDIEIYGITGAMLRQWTYDSNAECVVLGTEKVETTYKQPQAEIVPPDVEELYDGTWYGRDDQKKVVVKIVTESDGVVSEEVVSGDASDEEAYNAAVERARTKALYGDATGYGAADATLFGGGKGTKESPYLISNEEQLRAIAEALNEDETFADVYFKQTADIDVSSADWLPIGHGIMAKVKKAWTQVAAYPFLGNYDGDGFSISGLKIGTKDAPSKDPRMNFTAGLFGFLSGDHYSNEKITDDVRISRLENIKLQGVDINVTSEGQNYTGGLVGNAQNGFLIDNCSVTGKVSSYSKDSFARGAGLAGNVIRGTVLNSWTAVDVYAETDAGNVYAGGLYSIDNRVTSVNCYSLGTVTGDAAANNKVHIGGISGQAGGAHYNCYTAGDVTALKTTSDAGLLNGRMAGIAAADKVYYNSDAKLTVADSQMDPVANGVVAHGGSDGATAKSLVDMKSVAFAQELNENRENAATNLAALQEQIAKQTDLTHVIQFAGGPEDLMTWKLEETPVLEGTTEGTSLAKAKEEALEKLRKAYDANRNAVVPALRSAYNKAYTDGAKAIAAAENKAGVEKALKQAADNMSAIKKRSDRQKAAEEAARNKVTKPTGKVTILNTIANSARKTNDVIWDKSKVRGATNYEVNWKARSSGKWASAMVGNKARGRTTGLTVGGLYEIRVRPVAYSANRKKRASGAWSNTVYRYFHTTGKIRLASNSKGSFTMSWSKNSAATGYQVMFTTNSNGAGAAKNINTVGAKATSFTKKGLKSGRTYYVQIREIKKVGSKTYVGNISKPVAVKIK